MSNTNICDCGDSLEQHPELEPGYAPCSNPTCSCEDYTQEEQAGNETFEHRQYFGDDPRDPDDMLDDALDMKEEIENSRRGF